MSKINIKTNKLILIFAILIVISLALIFTYNRHHAQAQKIEESQNQVSTFSDSKDDPAVYMSDIDEDDLSNVRYIENSAYFIENPGHAEHNEEYNSKGTCTTIAMQMLLGYHNYYSDRRLIPKFGDNNRQFLSDDYGDFSQNPKICLNSVMRIGNQSIGTEVGVYDELNDLLAWGTFPALGQSVYSVASAAEKFIKKYSIICDNVTITASEFTGIAALSDLLANRPIILGMSMLLNGADSYHVMVAYGYATVNGVFGFIINNGRDSTEAHMWIPFDYISYQIRMEVEHTHDLVDAGINVQGEYRSITHRGLKCTVCGSTTVDELYETDENGQTITAVRYPVSGGLQIPLTINRKSIRSIGNGVFFDSAITSVDLQSNIYTIGDSAFENCKMLTYVSSFSNISSIGKYAFRGCNLRTDIEFSRLLDKIGDGAFVGCDEANVTVSENNMSFYADNNILYNKSQTKVLQAFNVSNSIIIPDSITEITPYAFESNSNIDTLRFNGNPQIGDYAFANCANLSAVYFDMYSAPTVGKDVFQNNVPTIYVPYNAQNDYKNSFSQYADYINSYQFAVDFISNGQVIDSKAVYNGSTIEDLPTPTLSGYDFGGWYDDDGVLYQNGGLWESETTIVLNAKWIPKKCSVVFDANGGKTTGNIVMTVDYGSNFTISLTVTKVGNVLDGWYDENNVCYVTSEGVSTMPWDKEGTYTLTAKWSIESYEIQINDDGSITWLSKDGLSNTQCTIEYGTILNAINLIAIFKNSNQGFKEGQIFDHFEFKGSTLDWTSVPDLGENNCIVTIVPVWIFEEHTIYFNTLTDVAVNPIKAIYGSKIVLPTPSFTGYIFDGWYTDNTYKTKVTWNTMPDLTPTEQSNGSTQLYAKKTPITYRIYYDANGGVGTMTFTTHIYNKSDKLRKCTFTKVGHDFIGWATSAAGKFIYTDNQEVVNLATEQSKSITLYAVWKPKIYDIVYKNLATNIVVTPNQYTYGSGISNLPVIKRRNASGQLVVIDKFYGWYNSDTFTTKITSISKTQTGTVTLYAKYDYFIQSIEDTGKTYTVTDAGISKNPDFELNINLKSLYYDIIKDTSLKKIKIEFSLTLWKVDDGYQHIYLYDGNFVNDSPFLAVTYIAWAKEIDHSGGKKQYKYTIELDISKFQNTDLFIMYFDASGAFSDTWKFNNFTLCAYLVN